MSRFAECTVFLPQMKIAGEEQPACAGTTSVDLERMVLCEVPFCPSFKARREGYMTVFLCDAHWRPLPDDWRRLLRDRLRQRESTEDPARRDALQAKIERLWEIIRGMAIERGFGLR